MKSPQKVFKTKWQWLQKFKMKKLFSKILIILTICVGVFVISTSFITPVKATMLKGYVESVPPTFWGTWRVKSKLISSDNPVIFKTKSLDIWNISQEGDVIILNNPFSGARGEVTINSVKNKTITFTKKGNYDNKILTDTVEITIEENYFGGVNRLILETISDVDGKVLKTETAQYSITGEKIGGQKI
jgi:hypothetical protein